MCWPRERKKIKTIISLYYYFCVIRETSPVLAEGEERRDYYGNEENANQASNDRGEQLCFENVYENFEISSMYMRE